MKNEDLLNEFMEENDLQYNVPFWIETSNWKVKVKIIKEHDTLRDVNIPKVRGYYNGEWKNTDSDTWLTNIVFNENYKIIPLKQKPIELGRYFIRTYTNPGDIVLDNAFGSGSFLVAALMEGRNFIGIEKNKDVALFKKNKIDYIDAAKKRLFSTWKSLDKITKKNIIEKNLIEIFERELEK